MGNVYVLVDPRNGEVRYVGMTTKPLPERLHEHMCQTHNVGLTHKDRWVRALKRANLRASIVELEGGIRDSDLPEAERAWIRKFAPSGRLTNGTAGGEGVFSYKHTPETKAFLAEKNRTRKVSAETRAKMSASQRARLDCEVTAEARANMSRAAKRRYLARLESRS